VLVGLAASALFGACSGEPEDAKPRIWIDAFERLIPQDARILVAASDLAVDGRGRVHVLDAGAAAVLRFDSIGALPVRLGLPSPEPLDSAATLALWGDTLCVFDPASGVLTRMDERGQLIDTTHFTGARPGQRWKPLNRTSALVATPEGDSALAIVTGTLGETLAALGPRSGSSRSAQPESAAELRAKIAAGEVPVGLKNRVLAAVGPDALWLAQQTEARVRRYSAGGELQMDAPVSTWDLNTVRGRFFWENTRTDREDVFPLSYFHDIEVVNGALWLMLAVPDEFAGILVVLDSEGATQATFKLTFVEGFRHFAVDAERDLVYLLDPDRGWLRAVAIPSELSASE